MKSETVLNQKRFQCKFQGCEFQTNWENGLKFHTRVIHHPCRPQSFPCALCPKTFSRQSKLDVHIRLHTQEKLFKCEICSAAYANHGGLRNHQKKAHEVMDNPGLEAKLRRYKCDQCEYRAEFRCIIARHALVHDDGEKPFACSVEGCSFRARIKVHVSTHLKTHKELPAKVYKCDQCDFGTRYFSNLPKHKRLLHCENMERPYACDHDGCEFRAKTKNVLKNHQRIHLTHAERGLSLCFKCPVSGCNYTTIHKRAINRHLLVHSSETPFECDRCQYKGKTKYGLNEHKIKRHTSKDERVKTAECPFCKKMFYNMGAMKVHALGHTGEKHFKCSYAGCSYETHNVTALRNHLNYKHLKVRYPSQGVPKYRLQKSKVQNEETPRFCGPKIQSKQCYVPLVRTILFQ